MTAFEQGNGCARARRRRDEADGHRRVSRCQHDEEHGEETRDPERGEGDPAGPSVLALQPRRLGHGPTIRSAAPEGTPYDECG